MTHHKIVIIGGGAAGITVAARLLNADPALDIAIIEPSENHYYQPLWTLVGGGIFPREQSRRNQADVIPSGTTWIQDFADSFSPESNTIHLRSGQTISYDFLVVAAGIQVNWNKIKGLQESIGKDGVCSNYSYDSVESTWRNIEKMTRGVALFTHPLGAVKCGGAPQKICYLAEDHFRKRGVRNQVKVLLTLATPKIFAVDKYAKVLEKVLVRKEIETHYKLNLIEIKSDSKEAIYEHVETKEQSVIKYDMIHVTPPMCAPDFISKSALAAETGWLDVDKFTLQHKRYENIFGLGDSANLPTSKTAAAIRKQAPVVVNNLLCKIANRTMDGQYDGYTSCPIVTGYDSMVLAEFTYDNKPAETFPFNQAEERFSMMMLKKYALPALYWHGMLKGRA